MPFTVYILQSEKDGSFYIGSTENIDNRLIQHNSGLSKYTRKKTPWKIVYTETFETRSEAMSREYFLKKQRNREFYARLINSQK